MQEIGRITKGFLHETDLKYKTSTKFKQYLSPHIIQYSFGINQADEEELLYYSALQVCISSDFSHNSKFQAAYKIKYESFCSVSNT